MDKGSSLSRFLVPEGRRFAGLLGALRRAGYATGPGEGAGSLALLVDTQDGRLNRAGLRLAVRTAGGFTLWHLDSPAGDAFAPFPGDPGARSFDSQVAELPEEIRAGTRGRLLLPLVRLRLSTSRAALGGPAGARFELRWESFSAAPPRGEAPARKPRMTLLTVRLAAGEPNELLHLSTYLRDRLGLLPERRDAASLGLADLGLPEPGAPAPEATRLLPADSLAVAGRKIVSQQVWKVRANTAGTLDDVDPEFLHDLRVATRRLRSALRLLGPALGERRTESLRIELGWIGQLLGAVRDLDVFILNLKDQSERLGESGRIATLLAAELSRRRAPEFEALEAGLRSRRHARLMDRLESLATSPPPRRPRGPQGQPLSSAAPELVGRAQKRVLRLGRAIGPASPVTDLHRLRILIKRLRYTCEFFRDAFPAGEGEAAPLDGYIGAMVAFQDCLGEHQDAVVAMRRVEALAKEMVAGGALAPERLMDLGALVQVQREIAADRRAKLARLWARFDRPSVRRAVRGPERSSVRPEAGETSAGGPS